MMTILRSKMGEKMKNAKYVEVNAGPRYWEDTYFNGKEDADGNIALRDGSRWRPVIRLEDGQVMDWQPGYTAEVHYKVCDDGEYWLQDTNGWRIAKYYSDYVPDLLSVGENGYGDYIIMKIDENGKIKGWKQPEIKEENWIKT